MSNDQPTNADTPSIDEPKPLVEESALETPPEAKEGQYHYDEHFLSRVLEGALLAFGEALSVDRLLTLFDEDKRPSKQQLTETLESIASQQDRGFRLKQVASGWRFEVCDDLAPWVNRLWDEKPQRYSRALLETLALIAYRQPLTRGDIEDVRGVAVSSHIIKTLLERDWVKVIGHRDVPGRPALYATTKQFLDYFSLKSLEELPSLGELQDIETLTKKLDLESPDLETTSEETSAENIPTVEEPTEDPIQNNDSDPQDVDHNAAGHESIIETTAETADVDTVLDAESLESSDFLTTNNLTANTVATQAEADSSAIDDDEAGESLKDDAAIDTHPEIIDMSIDESVDDSEKSVLSRADSTQTTSKE